ncbi:MAG: FlgD immunoglobulin-like domain containing protein [candidate division KSB1 bacterium]|nr:FlgD immunoglobulin-like domain containing protein [candidate division KSB1 bacterium]
MKRIYIIYSFLILLMTGLPLTAQVIPTFDTAVVDGNHNEWTEEDIAYNLTHTNGKTVYGQISLRFDDNSQTLYVYTHTNDEHPIVSSQYAGIKIKSANSVDNNSNSFFWINPDANDHAEGFEAAIEISGTSSPDIWIECSVIDGNKTSNAKTRWITLELEPYDHGDAPSSRGYSNAKHKIKPKHLRLGDLIDYEEHPLSNEMASADDNSNENDEDGITFLKDGQPISPVMLEKGNVFQIRAQVYNKTGRSALLAGWIDYNGDGTFAADEKVISHSFNSRGYMQSWTSPELTVPEEDFVITGDLTFARFRVVEQNTAAANNNSVNSMTVAAINGINSEITVGDISPDGTSGAGEVEDYWVQFDEPYDPVAVTLSSFTATEQADGVELNWRVETEVNHAGYNIYRSYSKEGSFEKANSEMIINTSFGSSGPAEYSFLDKSTTTGSVYYQLEAVDLNGQTELFDPISITLTTTMIEESAQTPTELKLNPNYPNPFNPITTIRFDLPIDMRITVDIYNMNGQLVRTLINGQRSAGSHSVTWDGADQHGFKVASGIYIYRLQTPETSQSKRMTLAR